MKERISFVLTFIQLSHYNSYRPCFGLKWLQFSPVCVGFCCPAFWPIRPWNIMWSCPDIRATGLQCKCSRVELNAMVFYITLHSSIWNAQRS